MSLKYGKKQIQQMIETLEGEHETVEDAALATLATAEAIFEDRAQFVVVGQLCGNRDRLTIPPTDPEAVRVSLGWYSTEGDARKAAESLWQSTASGDTFRTWVLPVFHGTPAEFHGKRKQHYVALQEKAAMAQAQRFKDSIRKIEERNAQRLQEIRDMEQAAGGQNWPCPSNRVKTGECLHKPNCK